MLGEVESDLLDAMRLNVQPIFPQRTFFGFPNENWTWKTGLEELGPMSKEEAYWVEQTEIWRTFKHSCGAVEPLVDTFIDCGFDILNPVQCSADGMDLQGLKDNYGDRITFWGGGVNTQLTLPFGTPEQVLSRCEVFAPNGGFVLNAIQNVQAQTPIKNVIKMIHAVREYNGDK